MEPAFWLGQPRTSAGSFVDYFNSLLGLGAVPRVAVRHPPPLHDRAEPEGGQRRRAAPRGARPAAALPGQGRRGRRRRDRLRRDDARRGGGAARAVRAREGARAARARAHAAPRQARRHPPHAGARRAVGHGARDGADRPQQRADGQGGPRLGLLGGLLDLPEHEDGRVPHGAHRRGHRDGPDPDQLGLRLGRVRSAQGRQDGRRDAARPGSPRTTSTRSSGATRSSSSRRAGG